MSIDIKVGKIVEAQEIAGSKNLIKLMVDIGGTVRQSIAALRDEYEPEQLKSKLVAVVTNLKPRKIFGQKSEVMVLAALDGSAISILCPDKQVGAGSKIS